ncbi:hypothetical protein BG005_003530 [Podila minutissima]|nr:hypothetical protein BG005_003530 [Podila minutissima]
MSKNKDPFLNTKPADLKDLCNNLPKPRHPRGLFISHKTVDQPLKPFFEHYMNKMFNHLKIQWPPGYAPCWFFTMAFNQADVAKQCDTPNHGKLNYILTTN